MHTFLRGAWFDCENCGDEYEDHPLAFLPRLCERCEEDADTAPSDDAAEGD